MANWHGAARSNYFRVKDEAAFKAWVATCPGLGFWPGASIYRGMFALHAEGTDDGAWPGYREIESEEWQGVDYYVYEDIIPHLAEGEVAVFMEAGAENLRYITGWAIAVTWDGRTVSVSLNDIYGKAFGAFGITTTPATY